jgi:hypothetical protein
LRGMLSIDLQMRFTIHHVRHFVQSKWDPAVTRVRAARPSWGHRLRQLVAGRPVLRQGIRPIFMLCLPLPVLALLVSGPMPYPAPARRVDAAPERRAVTGRLRRAAPAPVPVAERSRGRGRVPRAAIGALLRHVHFIGPARAMHDQ